MHVGDATIVKYANADAIDVAMPIIIGSIPRSKTIGPKTATVAALLNKFVIIEHNTTEKNQLTMVMSVTIIERILKSFAQANLLHLYLSFEFQGI